MMSKGRLEAFSDGVIAILITIMVLEFKSPPGTDWQALRAMLPSFFAYLLSFIFLGIYWTNHHHMLHAVSHVNGSVLWANLNLLFWLSLVPFGTKWVGENPSASVPTAFYGMVFLAAAVGYIILQNSLMALHGKNSQLARAVGNDFKGKLSMLLYIAAIPVAFWEQWVSDVLYVLVAFIWLVPDRRIESKLTESPSSGK
jgi:uncharacterized membrane protein